MSDPPRHRLLVIDDEAMICEFIATVGKGLGFAVRTLEDASEFSAVYEEFKPDVVSLDLQMPDQDGIKLIRYLGEIRSEAQILLASGMDSRVLATAHRLGKSAGLKMLGTLQKPIHLGDLEALLRRAHKAARGISTVDLERAIQADELVVYFQPKLNLQAAGGWRIDGAEALVRWDHPEEGLILPGRFIPLAEESGLITGLTRVVLDTTVRQAALWERHGVDVVLAVNLAPHMLGDPALPDNIDKVLEEHQLPRERLILEVTESAAMANPTRSMETLARLRLLGVGLSIDDFGTGYSSLKLLHQMPFSELKIDTTFVLELDSSEEARTIVRATISMAHDLGMTVCAEGAESEETLQFLTRQGCEHAQGFFISKAVPPEEFEKLYIHWGGADGRGPSAS